MAKTRQPKIPLRGCVVVVEHRGATLRFAVDSAAVAFAVSTRRPIEFRLEGPAGAIRIELPRREAWRLAEEFHDRSVARDG